MNTIGENILRAIYEGKWLSIEYNNARDSITRYWIGICDMNIRTRKLNVDGLHVGIFKMNNFDISIDSIMSARILDGTFQPRNEKLIRDIEVNSEKYSTVFNNTLNLKILNYLEMCNKMDASPYCTDYGLVHYLDGERVEGEYYQLSDEQFKEIVKAFNSHNNN